MTTSVPPSSPSELPQPISPRERRSRHLVRAAIVGLLAGALGIAYAIALVHAESLRGRLLEWLHLHLPRAGFLVLPTIGAAIGILIGWTTRRWAPEASGSGIPHIKAVLVHVRTLNWKRLLPIKFINGVLGAAIGLSLGREGPTVQMGAAVGRAAASALRLRPRAVPGLVALGAGAGLAAAFNAPLAGFIFVIEELQRELSPLTYGGALVAAVSADVVARGFFGQLPSFQITGYPALPLAILPIVAVLGGVAGVVGVLFNKALIASLRFTHRRTRVPAWAWPGLAGVTVGLAAWWLPQAVGGGHATAESILNGSLSILPFGSGTTGVVLAGLALLLVAKFLLTVISYASGAPGGIFAPMLLMGAILGLITGRVFEAFSPFPASSAAFAVLGMAGFFASSVRAPLTGIVLILEMTANYEQLFALSVVCLCAYLVAELLREPPVYDALLRYDLDRLGPAKTGDHPVHVVVSVHRGSHLDGRSLREAGMPKGALVIGLERRGQELIPNADLVIQPGDHLTVLVPAEPIGAALRVVDLAKAEGA